MTCYSFLSSLEPLFGPIAFEKYSTLSMFKSLVCVCVSVASSGFEGYSISVGPVMRLVHPITSPFACGLFAFPFKGQTWPSVFSPRAVLGILAGTNLFASVSIP